MGYFLLSELEAAPPHQTGTLQGSCAPFTRLEPQCPPHPALPCSSCLPTTPACQLRPPPGIWPQCSLP